MSNYENTGKDKFPGSKRVIVPKDIAGVQKGTGDPKANTDRIIKLIKDSNPKK